MNFWIMVLGFTLLIAVICFYPLLLNTRQTQSEKREQLNKALYFSRLKEIEQDVEQGLLENSEQAKVELQRTLLDDVATATPESAVQNADVFSGRKIWALAGLLSLAIVAGAVYSQVGAWQEQAKFEKAYEKLPRFYERVKEEDENPLSDQELQQFATALRVKLQKEPQDPRGWWLLGQVGMSLNNGNLAFDAYGKAVQLEPDNVEYKLSFARILMMSQDDREKMQGEELLKQVIRQDHSNLQALSLLAFYYFSKEDYRMAAVTWAMMLKLLPEDDSRRALIEKSIRAARDAVAEQKDK